MKTIIKKIVGVILVLVGLFALVTPFTPGSWLALIGLEMLGLLGVRLLIERALFLKGQRRQRLIQKLKDNKMYRLANYFEKRTPYVNKTHPTKDEEPPAKN
jgi:protein-S-isoprenylcysteine O-methyltransferase Ste14